MKEGGFAAKNKIVAAISLKTLDACLLNQNK